ncbi:MAG: metal ABC transporter permease [bacterium]|nr:metal ABC transporter permease [bacterium]
MNISEFLSVVQQREFLQNALLAAVLVSAVSGIVGCFVVVRGMSFFGDALAHSILPGVAAAYVFTGSVAGIPLLVGLEENTRLFLGGLIAGVISAVVIGWLTRDDRLKEDTAIGVVFVTMFALGIAIISSNPDGYNRDLTHILFGDILGIRDSDIAIMLACGVFVVGVILVFYKDLLVVSFDPGLGQTLKLPTETLRMLLLILIAVTIVASLQIIGVTMTLAMLITPAATARILTSRFHWMMVLAAVIGMASGVVGIYFSFWLNLATGPTIVLTSTAMFSLVFIASRLGLRLLPKR